MRPAIDVQLKETINLKGPTDGTYRFRLKNRNYKLLQGEKYRTPRLLVVLHMPRDKSQWITIVNDGLTLRRCAYWLNLREFDELDENADDDKYTLVHIPQENRFDDVSLRRLMDQARTGRIE